MIGKKTFRYNAIVKAMATSGQRETKFFSQERHLSISQIQKLEDADFVKPVPYHFIPNTFHGPLILLKAFDKRQLLLSASFHLEISLEIFQ